MGLNAGSFCIVFESKLPSTVSLNSVKIGRESSFEGTAMVVNGSVEVTGRATGPLFLTSPECGWHGEVVSPNSNHQGVCDIVLSERR